MLEEAKKKAGVDEDMKLRLAQRRRKTASITLGKNVSRLNKEVVEN